MKMKLEVIIIPVSDVDRAKAFYEKVGFRLDIDYTASEDFRVLQFTPPRSEASIIFGKGITSAKPGSAESLVLAVDDIDAARDDLIARGVNVSEVFHYAGGPFNNAVENAARRRDATRKVVPTSRLPRLRIQMGTAGCSRRSRTRLPGREWKLTQHRPRTSQLLQSSSTRRRSTMATTRRRTPSITGGTGMRPI